MKIRILAGILLSLFFTAQAQAADRECKIYFGAELEAPRGQCQETAISIKSAEIARLQLELQRLLMQAVADHTLNTGASPYDSYAIDMPSLEFFPVCCNNDPSDSSTLPSCKQQNSNGSCPEGTNRYLCSVTLDTDTGLTCTSIDD